jgi:hypothetical protein
MEENKMGIFTWIKKKPKKNKLKMDFIRQLQNDEIASDSVDPFERGIERGYEEDEDKTFVIPVVKGDTYETINEREIKPLRKIKKRTAKKVKRKPMKVKTTKRKLAKKKPVKRKTTKRKPTKRKTKKKTTKKKTKKKPTKRKTTKRKTTKRKSARRRR